MPPRQWVDLTLGMAALATSILTLLTAVIGVAVAVRELRRNTRITTRAAESAGASHAILSEVVHNGGVTDPPTPGRGGERGGHMGGGNTPSGPHHGRGSSSSDAT